jgi:hypothetical protein
MAIEIVGQYYLKIDIGNREDFIMPNNLKKFVLIEEAGNVLPVFELYCVVDETDSDLWKVLNENQDVKITMGKDSNNTESGTFYITKLKIFPNATNNVELALTGMLKQINYIAKRYNEITDEKNSIDVIKDKAGQYFTVDIGDVQTNDKQYWINYNLSDKFFINQLWLHGKPKTTTYGIAILMDDTFRIRYLQPKNNNQKSYDWRFIVERTEDTDIDIGADYTYKSENGFLNIIGGYGKTKKIHELEKQDYTDIESKDGEIFFANTDTLNKNTDVEKKVTRLAPINENTHKDYWQAYIDNVTQLCTTSTLSFTNSFYQRYEKIHPLDVIMVQHPDKEHKVFDYISGLYIITKVVRNIDAQGLVIHVVANRETPNKIEQSKSTGNMINTQQTQSQQQTQQQQAQTTGAEEQETKPKPKTPEQQIQDKGVTQVKDSSGQPVKDVNKYLATTEGKKLMDTVTKTGAQLSNATVSIKDDALNVENGSILGGIFNTATVLINAYASAGNFYDKVMGIKRSIFRGGDYWRNVIIDEGSQILGGYFNDVVEANGGSEILGGVFNGAVKVANSALKGGNYKDVIADEGSKIAGGVINGNATISNSEVLSGTFNGATKVAASAIKGGNFTNVAIDEGSKVAGTAVMQNATIKNSELASATVKGTINATKTVMKGGDINDAIANEGTRILNGTYKTVTLNQNAEMSGGTANTINVSSGWTSNANTVDFIKNNEGVCYDNLQIDGNPVSVDEFLRTFGE